MKQTSRNIQRLFFLAGAISFCLVASPPASVALTTATPPVIIEEPGEGFISYSLRQGTPVFVLLQTPISTALNKAGDPLDVVVTQDLYINNQIILPKNSRMKGQISLLEEPIAGRNAMLGFRFQELELPNGEILPIQAYVKTERPDHNWGGELTPGTKPLVVTHRIMGIGPYNKVVFGGPRAMGTHIRLQPGERLTLILEQTVQMVLPKLQSPDELEQ